MPVVNYHSANGRLIGETTSGVRTDYMSDALGSVTGTLNASQAVVNTYRYKPYGELLTKTGSGADPAFMWNGTTQSRRTGLTFSDQYNRARHYGTRQGRWTTVDPLIRVIPNSPRYSFAQSNPTLFIDPSGLITEIGNLSSNGMKSDPPGLTLNNCLQISLKFPVAIGPISEIQVRVKVCAQLYDNSCCPLPSASSCYKVEFLLVLSVAIPGMNLLDFLDKADDHFKSTEEAIKLISDLAFGSVNLLLGQHPIKGCPVPKDEWRFRICFGVCLVLMSAKICSENLQASELEFKKGYCGITPSLGLEAGVLKETCR